MTQTQLQATQNDCGDNGYDPTIWGNGSCQLLSLDVHYVRVNTGTLSAWQVFAMIGFYPQAGSSNYILGISLVSSSSSYVHGTFLFFLLYQFLRPTVLAPFYARISRVWHGEPDAQCEPWSHSSRGAQLLSTEHLRSESTAQ